MTEEAKKAHGGFETTPCKGCGKPVVWAITDDGKRIPLDPRPAVYGVFAIKTLGQPDKITCERANGEGAYLQNLVTHFATCSAVAQFSGAKKKSDTPT